MVKSFFVSKRAISVHARMEVEAVQLTLKDTALGKLASLTNDTINLLCIICQSLY